MNINDLAEKINSEILQRRTTTTSILREARNLGNLLNNHEFDWVENELKGYVLDNGIILPSYRFITAIESKTWDGQLNPSLHSLWKDWLNQTTALKWPVTQPVSELEGYLSSAYAFRTNKVLQVLGLYNQIKKPIIQVINFPSQEIQKLLDLIQDRVQEQVSVILTKPRPNSASYQFGIFFLYLEKFPQMKNDFEIISKYLETGLEHTSAARSCRPILFELVEKLINKKIPAKYQFTDGGYIENKGEKSKLKYYLEQKGEQLFHDRTKLISLDTVFREVYDLSSKANKGTINKYEANMCVDKLIEFLEKLNRYTDLKLVV